MSNFKQEDRYLILKRKDIDDSLLDEDKARLHALATKVCDWRTMNGKQNIEGVVVEKDWEPIYSQVWNAIRNIEEGNN